MTLETIIPISVYKRRHERRRRESSLNGAVFEYRWVGGRIVEMETN